MFHLGGLLRRDGHDQIVSVSVLATEEKKKRQEGDERDHREPRSDEHPGVCVCTSYIQQQLYLLKQTKHNESVKTRKKNWKSKFIKEKEKQVFVCLTSASLSLVIQLHPAQAMPVGTR